MTVETQDVIIIKKPAHLGQTFFRLLKTQLMRRVKAKPSMPHLRCILRDAPINQKNLAAYKKICNADDVDALPLGYPQLLVTPLMYELFFHNDFPFKLLGIIHLEHRVRQYASLKVGAHYDVDSEVLGCELTRRGYVFKIKSALSQSGRVVWESEGTFLSRTGSKDFTRDKRIKTDQPDESKVWTVAEKISLGSKLGLSYAKISTDYNPIHLNRWTAGIFGFRQPIVHGLWLFARCIAALNKVHGPLHAAEITFQSPVYLPNTVVVQYTNDLMFKVKSAFGAQVFAQGKFK